MIKVYQQVKDLLPKLTAKELAEVELTATTYLSLPSSREDLQKDYLLFYGYIQDHLSHLDSMPPLNILKLKSPQTYKSFESSFMEIDLFTDFIYKKIEKNPKKIERYRFWNFCLTLVSQYSEGIADYYGKEFTLRFLLNCVPNKMHMIFDESFPRYIQSREALTILVSQSWNDEDEVMN